MLDALTASVAFLWGGGKILDQFDASWFKGQFGEATDKHIALKPKQKNAIIKKLILVVNPKTYQVKQSIVVDLQKNVNQFVYSNAKINSGLTNKTFEFTPPKGTHVAKMPGSCN